jgi:NADH:ubiquinone oxidoreductase subunit 6 (subunit J)
MLTRSVSNLKERFVRVGANALAAGTFFVLLVLGVIWPIWGANPEAHFPVSDQTIRTLDLGLALVSGNGFVIPFEVASLLLTAAMIGAIVIARDADDDA